MYVLKVCIPYMYVCAFVYVCIYVCMYVYDHFPSYTSITIYVSISNYEQKYQLLTYVIFETPSDRPPAPTDNPG